VTGNESEREGDREGRKEEILFLIMKDIKE
jgi:hypothetical protein